MPDKIYITPTYHPASEQLYRVLATEYEIVFYNFAANERLIPKTIPYKYHDLKLKKIRLKSIDFAITNTLIVFLYILKRKPKEVVTEDYLFALPYIVAAKLIKSNLVYYNSSASSIATRSKNCAIKWLKRSVLRLFDEYWHGFHGAESYVEQYLDVKSRLVPWLLIEREKVSNLKTRSIKSKDLHGIYIGEFTKRKRIEYVLQFETLTNNNPEYLLKFKAVGCSTTCSYYEEKYHPIAHSEVFSTLARSDFLLLVSEREAMGAVVIEALSVGTFVVVSKEIGANSIIRQKNSLRNLPKGIVYLNEIGVIVDTDIVDPNTLINYISSIKDLIKTGRDTRMLAVEDYFTN